jgi:Fe-S-cluster containining protein
MSEQRADYGFRRSKCACAACSKFCHHIPGYLLPEDLTSIARTLGYADLLEFARDNLSASPGALAIRDGEVFRIHSLVPQRRADGSCKFLTENNLCSIHENSPFGCAYFDEHESQESADQKRNFGLVQLTRELQSGGRYSRIWAKLDEEGLTAPTPEEARGIPPEEVQRRMEAALAASRRAQY